ncbi:SpoIIE family protein phosphatase, partial [Streptomyces flaveolus]|uniref:SpoIIE family protein phosphatase n=1 Tax=Streptomyces flaveolus TaxID=67297 RepID=UPI0034343222
MAWNDEAENLLDLAPAEVLGHSVNQVVAASAGWDRLLADRGGRVRLRKRSGDLVEACLRISAIDGPPSDGRNSLVLFCPAAEVERRHEDETLIRTLLDQSRPGLIVYDLQLTIRRAAASWGDIAARRLSDVFDPRDALALEDRLRDVARTGRPLFNWEHTMRRRDEPDSRSVQSFSAFRMTEVDGRPIGLVSVSRDVTDLHRSWQGLNLLHRAVAAVGMSLDATRTAKVLVDVLVPDFASWAAVDLVEAIFEGDPMPGPGETWPARKRQAAVAQAPEGASLDTERRSRAVAQAPDTEQMRRLSGGEAFLLEDLPDLVRGESPQARYLREIFPSDARSVIVAPLFGGDGLLGVLTLARTAGEAAFDGEDLALVTELAPRAALNISNSWRFAREHQMVLALQRSLLPAARDRTPAAEVAGTYLSAGAAAGVGGDWYDTVPLSSFRTAFVVGDVVGHGLRAAAMMGRLRTAVQSFADLDLDPGELLARLDDLVARLSAEREAATGDHAEEATGTTCLYAVYDPVSRRCIVASAGHPPPALLRPDGSVDFIDLDPGPPLGVGGMPFEATEITVEPGSVLVLYTDGLVTQGHRDIEYGMRALLQRLSEAHRRRDSLRDLSGDIAAMLPDRPTDDTALLLARTSASGPADTTF